MIPAVRHPKHVSAIPSSPSIPSPEHPTISGVYEGTYASGNVEGSGSFKYLDVALAKLNEYPSAAAIVRTKNCRFSLRRCLAAKRANRDVFDEPTPPFVYASPHATESTWVRTSVWDHYEEYGPFTKSNPFDANRHVASSSALAKPAALDTCAIIASANPTSEASLSADVYESHDEDQPDESYSDDTDEVSLVKLKVNNVKYWCFPKTGHLLTYKRGFVPVLKNYTGKKVTTNSMVGIQAGGRYNTLVDGGEIPSAYVQYFHD